MRFCFSTTSIASLAPKVAGCRIAAHGNVDGERWRPRKPTALDGSTTPESFANIVAARARAADEQFFLSLAVALREAGALVETGAAAAAQRQRDVAAREAAWRADELQVADAERGCLRAEIARFDEEAAVLRDKLAFHAHFDGGAEENGKSGTTERRTRNHKDERTSRKIEKISQGD